MIIDSNAQEYSGESHEGPIPELVPVQTPSLDEINQKLDLLLAAQGIVFKEENNALYE